MKIGIMGTHGTGKSGLALKMAAQLKADHPGEQVGIVSEVARDCPHPVNRDTTEIAQRWIWHMQFIREIEAQGKHEIVVCDRTVLDSLAYSQVAGLNRWVNANLWDAVQWMETYDVIWFLRPGDEGPALWRDTGGFRTRPYDDGFRDTNPGFQKEVDRVLAVWVRTWQIRALYVGDGK